MVAYSISSLRMVGSAGLRVRSDLEIVAFINTGWDGKWAYLLTGLTLLRRACAWPALGLDNPVELLWTLARRAAISL